MSRSNNSRRGSTRGRDGKEYWKSRLHCQGETPGRFTKTITHRKERRGGRKLAEDGRADV